VARPVLVAVISIGLGWQPDVGRGAGAVGADVGVADVLAAGALGPGLPESTPAGPAAALALPPWQRFCRGR